MSTESLLTEAKSRIPVTLVTGFLGSGKTTFINAALRSPELAKTVVVVNEFGEVGLDHKLFASSSDSVVVLENCCLCCTVRSDLVGTLNSLYHGRQAGELPEFDNIVIETSGLAEPGAVLQAFLSEPTLDWLFRVASVLTLVDAVNWRGTAESHDEAVRQVALAEQIRRSKLDLVDAKDISASRLLLELRQINPSAEIAEVDWSSAAVAKLLTSPGFDSSDPRADPRSDRRQPCRRRRRQRGQGAGRTRSKRGPGEVQQRRVVPVGSHHCTGPNRRSPVNRGLIVAATGRRGGQPSTMTPTAGPCDSPKVVTRNADPKLFPGISGHFPCPCSPGGFPGRCSIIPRWTDSPAIMNTRPLPSLISSVRSPAAR